MTCVPARTDLCPGWADLRPAHCQLSPAHAYLCAVATYAPTYVPRYLPTYFWVALNMDIPMLKGGSNKTIQANIK